MTPIEDGKVNVCGLFPSAGLPAGTKRCALFLAAMRANGLSELAETLTAAHCHDDSFVGAAGFELGNQRPTPGLCTLGDSEAIIPPFTGNGMSMAFEAAESAVAPLAGYVAGEQGWNEAREEIDTRLRDRFRARLRAARVVHPFFLNSLGQTLLAGVSRAHLLPFRFMHSLLT
jgi:2-polyprenyl-6-methoxyphenol hydroxylase-like FAD-dependent oxidoreductase